MGGQQGGKKRVLYAPGTKRRNVLFCFFVLTFSTCAFIILSIGFGKSFQEHLGISDWRRSSNLPAYLIRRASAAHLEADSSLKGSVGVRESPNYPLKTEKISTDSVVDEALRTTLLVSCSISLPPPHTKSPFVLWHTPICCRYKSLWTRTSPSLPALS